MVRSVGDSKCRYLVRFDDICPTMNWSVWGSIEKQLLRYDIQPILAVVPDNQDKTLCFDPSNLDFWKEVKRWQSLGYTIALHGYQHQYVNSNSGIIGLSTQSEFAGLSYHDQDIKLRKALAIFSRHNIRADAWIAPSHSFDQVTVSVLAELGVRVISDGLWRWPFTDSQNMTWVPQQIWDFCDRPPGIWTVCNHHNNWSAQKVLDFEKQLYEYHSRITSLNVVLSEFRGRRQSFSDRRAAFLELAWNHRLIPVRRNLREFIDRCKYCRAPFT